MLRLMTVLCVLAGWPAGLLAEWSFESDPESGRYASFVCATQGEKRLCFGLACNAQAPLRFSLSTRGDAGLLARGDLNATVFVGQRTLPVVRFESSGLSVFEAPLTEAHVPGLEWLKAGWEMQLRYWDTDDMPPVLWRMTLKGSRDTIEALEATCPLPDFAAAAEAVEVVTDPAGQVRADLVAACAELNGEVTQRADYVQDIDIDGAPPMDLRVNHGALECSAETSLVCGPAGCLTSLWQAQASGGYVRVFLNTLQNVESEGDGRLRFTYRGSRCGRAGSPCDYVYKLDGSGLVRIE